MNHKNIRMRKELQKYFTSKKFMNAIVGYISSFIVSFIFVNYIFQEFILKIIINDIASTIMTVAAGMLTIVITAFAIFTTIETKFTLFVKTIDEKKGTTHLPDLLFSFWWTSVLWGIVLIISFIGFLLIYSPYYKEILVSKSVLFFMIYFTLLAIYFTIEIVGNVYKLGILRSNFYYTENNKKKNVKGKNN